MTADRGQPRTRRRGRVRRLPSGSLQVTVYAGEDPLTGKRIDLSETVPAGTNAAKEAEKVRGRLLNQVDEQRNPRTSATMNQLMNRYIEVIDVDRTTRKGYESRINSHIRPLLGHLPSHASTGGCSTRSSPSCAPAALTAVARDERSTTAPTGSMLATGDVVRTYVDPCPPR